MTWVLELALCLRLLRYCIPGELGQVSQIQLGSTEDIDNLYSTSGQDKHFGAVNDTERFV
jgi:hypothetical protein